MVGRAFTHVFRRQAVVAEIVVYDAFDGTDLTGDEPLTRIVGPRLGDVERRDGGAFVITKRNRVTGLKLELDSERVVAREAGPRCERAAQHKLDLGELRGRQQMLGPGRSDLAQRSSLGQVAHARLHSLKGVSGRIGA